MCFARLSLVNELLEKTADTLHCSRGLIWFLCSVNSTDVVLVNLEADVFCEAFTILRRRSCRSPCLHGGYHGCHCTHCSFTIASTATKATVSTVATVATVATIATVSRVSTIAIVGTIATGATVTIVVSASCVCGSFIGIAPFEVGGVSNSDNSCNGKSLEHF